MFDLSLRARHAIAGLAIIALSARAVAQSFEGLGVGPGGWSDAYAVSANGSVVVGVMATAVGSRAFRCTASGVLQNLGTLGGSYTYSEAYGVSGDGTVVVGSFRTASGWLHPFKWTTTGMIDLDPELIGRGEAFAVSRDGQIAVGYKYPDRSFGQATRWLPNGDAQFLGYPVSGIGGFDSNLAIACSANGDVSVGIEHYAFAPRLAFRWTQSGGMANVGSANIGDIREARDVSANGEVVVGSAAFGDRMKAFRWTIASGMTFIDPAPWSNSYALGVSGDGNTIVGNKDDAAFVWTAKDGMRMLKDVLMAAGVEEVQRWGQLYARAISDDGKTIVGVAWNPLGQWEAWRARLEPAWVTVTAAELRRDPFKTAAERFYVHITTKQNVTAGSGTLKITVSGFKDANGNAVPMTWTTTCTADESTKGVRFTLASRRVARFAAPLTVTVRAELSQSEPSGEIHTTDATRSFTIRLPLIVVRGIKPLDAEAWEDDKLVNYFYNRGYRRDTVSTVYPTFFYLLQFSTADLPRYDPTRELIGQNAISLKRMVDYITDPSRGITYARRVDIVSHSKGGLVARQYLKVPEFDGPQKVRRLVLCTSPHLGSMEAWYLSFLADPQQRLVLEELYPIYPWYRESDTQPFGISVGNLTLLALINSPIPQSVEYYLYFGYGVPRTKLNSTAGATGYTDYGDGYVTGWSQRGLNITYDVNANPIPTSRIRAFPSVNRRAERGFPLGHSGFMGNIAPQIYSALSD